MRPERREDRGEGQIGDAKFGARGFNDLADVRIVYVADPGKQMVLDLKVQAAETPGHERVGWGEVGRGLDFMDRPLLVHGRGLGRWRRKTVPFDRMGQLKDRSQCEPEQKVHP